MAIMEYVSDPTDELEIFRAIILYGKNTASYKFALGKALIQLASENKTFVSLEDLAMPFAQSIIEHVKAGKRQTVTASSKFLYGCQLYAENKIDDDQLIQLTKKEGFKYVIDAFPNLGSEIDNQPVFYHKSLHGQKGIELTDHLYRLVQNTQINNIAEEIEGRWNLVEASWTENNPSLLIEYDDVDELFVSRGLSDRGYLDSHLRKAVTAARRPLSGYQKGKCFYCYDDISIEANQPNTAQVDHFLPISLQSRVATKVHLNLNDIWNLVLACKSCNASKSNRTPSIDFLYDLERRNNYYISSKHPLGETIQFLTGRSVRHRRYYLKEVYSIAREASALGWKPKLRKGMPF